MPGDRAWIVDPHASSELLGKRMLSHDAMSEMTRAHLAITAMKHLSSEVGGGAAPSHNARSAESQRAQRRVTTRAAPSHNARSAESQRAQRRVTTRAAPSHNARS